ncbi:MAG TPA: carboxypeptidase-like regulatory domain-containing protein, partial [Puia sp.]
MIPITFCCCNLYASNGKTGPCLIRGQVVDAITKKPVSGVVVSAVITGNNNSNAVITDNEGYYYFKELPSNHVNL